MAKMLPNVKCNAAIHRLIKDKVPKLLAPSTTHQVLSNPSTAEARRNGSGSSTKNSNKRATRTPDEARQEYIYSSRVSRRLTSYVDVCVNTGEIEALLKILPKMVRADSNASYYNVLIRKLAKSDSISAIRRIRLMMMSHNIKPDAETFASLILSRSRGDENSRDSNRRNIVILLKEMKALGIDVKLIFNSTYMNPKERESVRTMMRSIDPNFEDKMQFPSSRPVCKLLDGLSEQRNVPYDFKGDINLTDIEDRVKKQRSTENDYMVEISAVSSNSNTKAKRTEEAWFRLKKYWRRALYNSIERDLNSLRPEFVNSVKSHIYPYLKCVDRPTIIEMLLDQVEVATNATTFSLSAHYLHLEFGAKIMTKYFRMRELEDGSADERSKVYDDYVNLYCSNPDLMGRVNPREYIMHRALETKNYAVYRDVISPYPQWPRDILSAVGRFYYRTLLKEIKFDPDMLKDPDKTLDPENMVPAFFTAYFQLDNKVKSKEEFRAHTDFEKLYERSHLSKLRFSYSCLPSLTPPMPWISPYLGGYLVNKSELVRTGWIVAENPPELYNTDPRKLYPTMDSLNVIGLCPWIVNKKILDLAIGLFKDGGNPELGIPLEASQMDKQAPKLPQNATKTDKILYNREKKKFDQKKKEMYSLWCDSLYRLSIANHFRDLVFWFPHNIDFRGRSYPIPPHFNHLGADLSRALLLFAKGKPLGERGLDWLKIHIINLCGDMKHASMKERLDYANTILDLEIIDSAEDPWGGRCWWLRQEDPWQVLACAIEISNAIKSGDPSSYECHFPVHQDGSCNGLQHYAALGRDSEGAAAVNLVPSERPQDVYSEVARIVESKRRQDEDKGLYLAKLLEGFITRRVIKQTVMTSVYGVTQYGGRHQIANQLAAKKFPEKRVWSSAAYLCKKTFESVGQMFKNSRAIQDWLYRCAYTIATKCRSPVVWETPLGLLVTQPYMRSQRMSSHVLPMAVTIPVAPLSLSAVNESKQRTAFAPNFIHSLDSSHMMLTSIYCQKAGITFVSVHDCFWTHPSDVDVMNRICRDQFIKLHSEPILSNLSQQFVSRYGQRLMLSWYDADCFKDLRKKKAKRADKIAKERTEQQKELIKLEEKTAVNPSEPISEKAINPEGHPLSLEEPMKLPPYLEPPGASVETHDVTRMCEVSALFRSVPQTGDLDLNVVRESPYFFC